MGSINKHISRYDFTAVYTHPEAKADIVLVHGLNGDPQRTWTAKNGLFWPTDLLPASLKAAHANVLVYGYNADVYSTRNGDSATNNFIHHHAQTLVTALTHYRKSEDSMQKPIIWVAHSLGGVLTKSALLYSNDLRDDHHWDYRSIFVSTYAIIFLGTPHNGTDLATWGHALQSMSDAVIPRRFFDSEPVLLKSLKKDSETLQNINNHFLDIYQRFTIHMAHENHKTDIKGAKVMVVPSTSASPPLPGVTYYGIEANHSRMCKFDSVNAPGYRIISTSIQEWVTKAPPVIQVRWVVEFDDRDARAKLEFSERKIQQLETNLPAQTQVLSQQLRNNEKPLPNPESELESLASRDLPPLSAPSRAETSDTSSRKEPLFVHPEPFRPNSFFIGRENELKRLHKMLIDRGRRSQGTSAVLIQCLPGGGKTHLARQYVFQYRQHYPGGIYWVRAKSRQELEYWYWKMAKNEAVKKLASREEPRELGDPKKIVSIVRNWLNSFGDWLVVLDGVLFDIPDLQEFIPDAKNTSLIYTSTERAVTGDYLFDNPQVMELGLLSAEEAQELLLLEMDKKKPWTQDDLARALELIQLMGRLPQMIHVAAQHLKATREPLSKYLRSYRSRPKAASLPAYKAVMDQLQDRGATAALNLMSILVFFDQHIPVEMLTLGLSALDNRTPVKSYDATCRKSNLSNTVAVLISFALLERTEGDDISSDHSESSKSLDKDAESLDLLRIHSVVQAFFVDTLSERREAHFWMERAAAVWCRSFDRADKKVKDDDSKVGLPDDYRRYAIHGRRLTDNLRKFEKKSPEWLRLARGQIEQRLGRVDREIDQLSRSIQAHIVDGSREAPPTSVFERSSSTSETETDSTTPPSQNSIKGIDPGSPLADEPSPIQLPPNLYGLDNLPNPYHWHVPYPSVPTMPDTPAADEDEEDAQTVVGTPVAGQSARSLARVPSAELTEPATGSLKSPDPFADWGTAVPNHRTVRRAGHRRYRDYAGSWRDDSVSGPRVSISREFAKGCIAGVGGGRRQSSSREAPINESEAASRLHKIKAASPPIFYRRGSSNVQDNTTRLPPGASSRPHLALGTNSYAGPSATLTPKDEYTTSPIEFSKSLSQLAVSPSSWTAATVRRLKDNLQQTPKTLPDGGDTNPRDTPSSSAPPGRLFRGSRSHSPKSNPGRASPTSPRLHPVTIDPNIPTPRNPSGSISHRGTQSYYPNPEPTASYDIGYLEDPTPRSFPFTARETNPATLQQPPRYWVHDPGGYSSQPMTRGQSHQSNQGVQQLATYHSHSGHVAALSPSSPAGFNSPATSGGSLSHQHTPGAAAHATGRRHRFSLGLKRRQPSHTVTEPSPHMAAMDVGSFTDTRTGHHDWDDDRFLPDRRNGAGGYPNSTPPSRSPPSLRPTMPHEPLGLSPSWLLDNDEVMEDETRKSRSQSQSHSTSLAPILHRLSRDRGRTRHIRPSHFLTQRRGANSSQDDNVSRGDAIAPHTASGRLVGQPPAAPGPDFSPPLGHAPEMSPALASGSSGGFMLPDGRVVEFGDVAPAASPSARRHRLSKRKGQRPSEGRSSKLERQVRSEPVEMKGHSGEPGLGIYQGSREGGYDR